MTQGASSELKSSPGNLSRFPEGRASMDTRTNQRAASRLLEVSRRGGYSVGLFLGWKAKSYLFGLIYLAAAIAYFAYVGLLAGCFLVVGLFAGMWFRDYGYLLAAKKTWQFQELVTDREKV